MTVMEKALRSTGFKSADELIPQQLSNMSVSCQKAGTEGYKAGLAFVQKKAKFCCPYAAGSQEHKIWWRGFDFGKDDAKK